MDGLLTLGDEERQDLANDVYLAASCVRVGAREDIHEAGAEPVLRGLELCGRYTRSAS